MISCPSYSINHSISSLLPSAFTATDFLQNLFSSIEFAQCTIRQIGKCELNSRCLRRCFLFFPDHIFFSYPLSLLSSYSSIHTTFLHLLMLLFPFPSFRPPAFPYLLLILLLHCCLQFFNFLWNFQTICFSYSVLTSEILPLGKLCTMECTAFCIQRVLL